MPALERFDGFFFRVARKHLSNVKDVDVAVMNDDFNSSVSESLLPYSSPEGKKWGCRLFLRRPLKGARIDNEAFLDRKLKDGKYSEVYLAMSKKYTEALPDLAKCNTKNRFSNKWRARSKSTSVERMDFWEERQ